MLLKVLSGSEIARCDSGVVCVEECCNFDRWLLTTSIYRAARISLRDDVKLTSDNPIFLVNIGEEVPVIGLVEVFDVGAVCPLFSPWERDNRSHITGLDGDVPLQLDLGKNWAINHR